MKKNKLKNGLFISFEGGEGSGKSTQVRLLAERLARDGYTVRAVREPGGSKIGEAIRAVTHNKTHTLMSSRTEALLFAACRAQLVEEVYRPLLKKGTVVLADRYVDSSYVYQGIGRSIGFNEVKEINDFAINSLLPDITFLLDIDYQEGQKRRHNTDKVDRMDLQTKSFYHSVHQGYRELAKKFKSRIVTIEASGDIQSIHTQIYDRIKRKISKLSNRSTQNGHEENDEAEKKDRLKQRSGSDAKKFR